MTRYDSIVVTSYRSADAYLGPRVRHALVSDAVMGKDLDPDEARRLLKEPMSAGGGAPHLLRQLGLRTRDECLSVAEFLVRELDTELGSWPPPVEDHRHWGGLVRTALAGSSSAGLIELLDAGPPPWRQTEVSGTVKALKNLLFPEVERRLTSELQKVISRWVDDDIPGLEDRWQREHHAKMLAKRTTAPTRSKGRRDPPTPNYTPPGRT